MGDDQSCSDVLICAIVHLFSWIYDYIMVFSSMWWNDGDFGAFVR